MRPPFFVSLINIFMKMQLRWRKLAKAQTDWELVLGVFWIPLSAVTLMGMMLLPARFAPTCSLRNLTGIACPTCGAYRSARLLMQGRWGEALVMQPFVVGATVLLAFFSLYSLVVVLGRLPRLRLDGLSRKQCIWIWLAVLIAFLVNWGYLVTMGR